MGAEPRQVNGADDAASDFFLDLGERGTLPPVAGPDGSTWRLSRSGLRAAVGAIRHPGTRSTLGLVTAIAAAAGLGQAAGVPAGWLAAAVLTAGLLLGVRTSTAPAGPADASPAELVAGRLLAGGLTALGLLLPALSVLVWATRSGPVLLVTVLFTAVACAFGTACTVLVPRRPTAAALAAVTLLAAGPVLLYSAWWPQLAARETVLVRQMRPVDFGALIERTTGYDPNICASRQVDLTVHHTEQVWLLLGLSPYPTLADARTGGRLRPDGASRFDLQEARLGPELLRDGCDLRGASARRLIQLEDAGPSWPYGLVVDLLLAAGVLGAAVRRREPA
jgi:hypothetical protein